jgi:predicted CoA-binding protein
MKQPDDTAIADILRTTRTIALVGWSPDPARASHGVARFLAARGYRVIPVNPGHAGQVVLGETVRASLAEISDPVDMVDIFRRSEAVLPVVQEALAALPGLKTVWMQLGVENADAAALAEARGLQVVQNRCPAIEIPRLGL